MKLVPLCLALLVAGCGGASIDSADAAGDLGAGLPPDLALSADVDLGTSDLDTDGGFVPAGIVPVTWRRASMWRAVCEPGRTA